MNDKMYLMEGSFIDNLTSDLKHAVHRRGLSIKSLFGDKEAAGKLIAKNTAELMYNSFTHYMGSVGEKPNRQVMYYFLNTVLKFSPSFSKYGALEFHKYQIDPTIKLKVPEAIPDVKTNNSHDPEHSAHITLSRDDRESLDAFKVSKDYDLFTNAITKSNFDRLNPYEWKKMQDGSFIRVPDGKEQDFKHIYDKLKSDNIHAVAKELYENGFFIRWHTFLRECNINSKQLAKGSDAEAALIFNAMALARKRFKVSYNNLLERYILCVPHKDIHEYNDHHDDNEPKLESSRYTGGPLTEDEASPLAANKLKDLTKDEMRRFFLMLAQVGYKIGILQSAVKRAMDPLIGSRYTKVNYDEAEPDAPKSNEGEQEDFDDHESDHEQPSEKKDKGRVDPTFDDNATHQHGDNGRVDPTFDEPTDKPKAEVQKQVATRSRRPNIPSEQIDAFSLLMKKDKWVEAIKDNPEIKKKAEEILKYALSNLKRKR